MAARVVQVAYGPRMVVGRRWRGETDHHAHGGGLAGAVGAEEAGDAGLDLERDMVDGGEGAVPLGEVLDWDHGVEPVPPAGPAHRAQGRSASDLGSGLRPLVDGALGLTGVPASA